MSLFTLVLTAVLPLLASEIKSDEVVVFYPSYARLDEDGRTWTIFVHGVVFEPQQSSLKRSLAISVIRRQLDVEKGTRQWEILDRRVRHFLVDHERGKEISIRLGSQVHKLGRSGPNGHFRGNVRLSAADVKRLVGDRQTYKDRLSFRAVTRKGDKRRFTGRVQLIGQSGLSLISDIDDTIKDTQVANRKAMLANTFLRKFKPLPGMSELYRQCARQGTAFHYVSGSPWQLYEPLSDFCRAEGFPPGSFHLKHFRLTDSTVLNLLASQEKTKRPAIESILAAFPRRRFILVGDSGEEDPEIYGKIARRHPEQVVAIFIRNVTSEAARGERFRTAFEGIQNQRWKVFHRPEELGPQVTSLVETYGVR